MARLRFSTPTKLEIAREWLRAHMEPDKGYSAGLLQSQAISEGIKRRTLQLAATYEVEVSPQYGAHGVTQWQWRLR